VTERGGRSKASSLRMIVPAIGIALLFSSGCTIRTEAPERNDPALDSRIQREVEARLAAEPELDAGLIRVEVRGGRVHLYGSVAGIGAWNCALRTSAMAEDVRSVIDFLVIERGPPRIHCLAPRSHETLVRAGHRSVYWPVAARSCRHPPVPMSNRSVKASARSRRAAQPRKRPLRSTQSAKQRTARRHAVPLSVALTRLAGGSLFLVILVVSLSPLRDAAIHARDIVVDAAAAGRYAAAREASIIRHALRYGISFELAAAIERAAIEEGIDPDLGFRLVRVESRFRERAVSSAGALGLTQLMPGTAAELQPGITREQIFDRDTNLRLGFRYFRWLLGIYDGDIEEALHGYNRGPGTVARIRAAGGDPANGYADLVLRGGRVTLPYRGNGLHPTLPPPLPEPWTVESPRSRSPISGF
jgi:soluble lytic murein transglycosylase-like protein